LAKVSKGLLVSQCPVDACNIPVSAIHDPGHGRGVIICFVMIMLGICFIMIVMTMVMPTRMIVIFQNEDAIHECNAHSKPTPNSQSCTIRQQNPPYSFNNCGKMLAEASYTNPPAVKYIMV
jgi:hypothetical protein